MLQTTINYKNYNNMKTKRQLQTAFSAAIAISAAALISSCGTDTCRSGSDNTIDFTRQSVENVYTLEGSASDYNSDHDLTIACRSTILMPERIYGDESTALRDSIVSAAFGKAETYSDTVATEYFRKYASELGFNLNTDKDTKQFNGESLYKADGYITIEGSVESLSQTFLSYAVETDFYYPRSAHGSSNTKYINYDIESGRIIELDDIFVHEKMNDELVDKIRERAKAMEALAGPISIEGLPANGNFYVTNSGDIVFAYQPYEAASYAQGVIDVRFQPYELTDMMSKEGRQLFNLPSEAG